MRQVNGDDKQQRDNGRINRNRKQRVHAAQPSPAEVLHVKLLKQTDADADEYRIYDGVDNGAARREARQPGEQRKNYNRQQDRGQLSAGGNRNVSGSEFHRVRPVSCVVVTPRSSSL